MKRKVELLLMAMALIVLAIIFLQETTTKCVLLVVLIVLQVITEKEIKECHQIVSFLKKLRKRSF